MICAWIVVCNMFNIHRIYVVCRSKVVSIRDKMSVVISVGWGM